MAPLQNLHVKLILPTLSPLLDNVTWDFSYFTTFTTQDATDLSQLATTLVGKVNAIPTGGVAAINSYVSPTIDRGSTKCGWQIYDVSAHLNGTPAGSPVLIGSWTLGGTPADAPIPEGVAATVTLQAPYGTDVEFLPNTRPRARDRGRLYFGPLSISTLDNDVTTHRTKLKTNFMGDLTKWIKDVNVITSAAHTVVWNLAVWSRKNAAMKSLQEVWVDDRPDYQRRRTDQSTIKTILGLP